MKTVLNVLLIKKKFIQVDVKYEGFNEENPLKRLNYRWDIQVRRQKHQANLILN